jgi:Ca2+-binding RTX toxin-like protein
MIGGPRRDLLSGGRGSDTIDGAGGNDYLLGDAASRGGLPAADHVFGGPGNDEIYTSSGIDAVSGGPGNDILGDLAGHPDSLLGFGGNDQIIADIAAPAAGHQQQLDDGRGVDEVDLLGNTVNPTAATAAGSWDMATGELTFTVTDPVVLTASRFEKGDLTTFGATWTIQGTARGDYISVGGAKGGTFTARGGDDTFFGSVGDDTFDGGPGTDHALTMGIGVNTCISVEIIDNDDCVTP